MLLESEFNGGNAEEVVEGVSRVCAEAAGDMANCVVLCHLGHFKKFNWRVGVHPGEVILGTSFVGVVSGPEGGSIYEYRKDDPMENTSPVEEI